jgi:tetratricopeptide (TPR) repeat protein
MCPSWFSSFVGVQNMRTFAYLLCFALVSLGWVDVTHAGRVIQFEILVDDQVVLVATTLDNGEKSPDEVWRGLTDLPVQNPAKRFVVSEQESLRLSAFHEQVEAQAQGNTAVLRGKIRIFCRYAGDITVDTLRLTRQNARTPWYVDPDQVDAMATVRTVDPRRRSRSQVDQANAAEAPPAEPRAEKDSRRLYEGFSGYSRAITCSSPEVQAWFDQGIQLLYGFNHDEAIRSFEKAAELDPSCAMAWWGSAYARGIHINNPEMSETQSRLAYEASEKARHALDKESPAERALIEAISTRYQLPVPTDRKPLDHAYAAAMERAWHQFPDDPDIGALFAESLMNLQPWDLWTQDAKPKGRALEIVAVLERTLARHPNHPGANHLFVHAIEASPWPELGEAVADRLLLLVPGSGHLVHMPSHIYIRIGRYADATAANTRAIDADEAYFALAPAPEFYNVYFLHNLHFLAYAAMMEGQKETALSAARKIETEIPSEFLKGYVTLADGFMPTTLHVLLRFGEWESLLKEPEPESWRLFSRAEWHFARSVALSNLKRLDEAATELQRMQEICVQVTDEWKMGNNPAKDVLIIARLMAEGELAFHSGQRDKAFAKLREGVALEEKLAYDEPPGWMQPVRHALGALLLADERYPEAESVYRADLQRHPKNAWSLLGLQQALRKLGNAAEADAMEAHVQAAWARADVQPKASCYCHPDAKP